MQKNQTFKVDTFFLANCCDGDLEGKNEGILSNMTFRLSDAGSNNVNKLEKQRTYPLKELKNKNIFHKLL